VKTYLFQRLGIAVLTLFGMSVVIFVLLRLAPGDIVDILFSTGGYVNVEERKAIMKELGIDKPLVAQYLEWIRNFLVGDLGKSYRYDQPAWDIIRPLIPVTLELAVLSTLVAICIGVPTGVISAIRQDTTLDYALRVFSLAGLSMPGLLARDGDHPGFGVVSPVDPPRHLRGPAREPVAPHRAVRPARPRRGLPLIRPHHAHHALRPPRGHA
jgi:ABC-type dipeptide/oligopeptide/nickel transport system permease component